MRLPTALSLVIALASPAALAQQAHDERPEDDRQSRAYLLRDGLRFQRVAASDGDFSRPHDIALSPDGAYLLVADIGNDVIRVLDPETLKTLASFGENDLSSPHDVAFQSSTSVLVADTANNRIAVYDFRGVVDGKAEARLIASLEDGADWPEGVSPAPGNGPIYVSNVGGNSVSKLTPDGKLIKQAGERGDGDGQFVRPHDIQVAPNNDIFVADSGNHRVQILDADLNHKRTLAGSPYHFNEPKYMAFNLDSTLYVADEYNSQIKIFDETLKPLGFIGTGGKGDGPGQLNWPEGVDVRAGRVWIADTDNNRILLYRRLR